MTEKSKVQSLDRAFDILELLCRSHGGMTLAALADETGLSKSTVHRLLASMLNRGYVYQDSKGALYHAGMRICELSGYIIDNIDIVARAREPMEQLNLKTRETIHLVMQEGAEIVYIHKVESDQTSIRMFSRIGIRRPMYCTAVGKAILATLKQEEVLALWKASVRHTYTAHTITDQGEFFKEINQIREDGYAIDNEENELGIRCIAAAINDWRGYASYALSISAPASRFSDERIRLFAPLLLETRDQIASVIGG